MPCFYCSQHSLTNLITYNLKLAFYQHHRLISQSVEFLMGSIIDRLAHFREYKAGFIDVYIYLININKFLLVFKPDKNTKLDSLNTNELHLRIYKTDSIN